MEQLKQLVVWIITYSVNGDFFHFVGCWLIVVALVRALHLFRVNVTNKTETKVTKSAPASEPTPK